MNLGWHIAPGTAQPPWDPRFGTPMAAGRSGPRHPRLTDCDAIRVLRQFACPTGADVSLRSILLLVTKLQPGSRGEPERL